MTWKSFILTLSVTFSLTVGKGVFVDIFYFSSFPPGSVLMSKNPPKNSLQSHRRKNRLLLCFSALSGGNCLSMDRDNVLTRPDVLEPSTWTVKGPTKIHTNDHNKLVFAVYMARTYRSWPVFKLDRRLNHCPSVRLGFSQVSEAN